MSIFERFRKTEPRSESGAVNNNAGQEALATEESPFTETKTGWESVQAMARQNQDAPATTWDDLSKIQMRELKFSRPEATAEASSALSSESPVEALSSEPPVAESVETPELALPETPEAMGEKIKAGELSTEQAYNLIRRISPNYAEHSTKLFKANLQMSIAAPYHLSILGFMTGGPREMSHWQGVNESNYARFVDEYPDAIAFDQAADDFLGMLKFVKSERADDYARVMESFKHTIYGDQQDYLNAVKSAQAKPEETQ